MDIASEIIVSRMTCLAGSRVRLVGLSTSLLASASCIADFLNAQPSPSSLYQFRNSGHKKALHPGVITIGFSEKCYSSRSRAMDSAVWDMIQKYCPTGHPVVVVVPSRKQMLKSAELLLHNLTTVSSEQIPEVQDKLLQHMLCFGIGLYHDLLCKQDLMVVEDLQKSCKIKVIIITASISKNAVFPSHLLVVKGTERYNEECETFEDYSIAELNQLISPSHASCSVCKESHHTIVIFTEDSRTDLLESYFRGAKSVESSLLECLPDYLNVEIATGIVQSKKAADEFVSCTYLSRRLVSNPALYLGTCEVVEISSLTSKVLQSLVNTDCIKWDKETERIVPTVLGQMVAQLKVSQDTLELYLRDIALQDTDSINLLKTICESRELKRLALTISSHSQLDSSSKVFQVLMFYISHNRKCTQQVEYIVQEAFRLVRVAVVLCASRGWLVSMLCSQKLLQMLTIGSRCLVQTLPHMSRSDIRQLEMKGMGTLPQIVSSSRCNSGALYKAFKKNLPWRSIWKLNRVLKTVPLLDVSLSVHLPDIGWYKMKVFGKQGPCSTSRVHLSAGRRYFLNVGLCVDTPSTWTLVLGHVKNREVLAYRQFHGHLQTLQNIELVFNAPSRPCSELYTLYILSNQFLGLDQEYKLHFKVIEGEGL